MEFLLLACRVALSAVFVIAGVAKLRDRKGFLQTLEKFGSSASIAPVLAALIPPVELVCALSLLVDRWAATGALAAGALLVIFTLAIIATLARGRIAECHCFGQLNKGPVSWQTFVRNALLLAAAALVAVEAPRFPRGWKMLSDYDSSALLVLNSVLVLAVICTILLLTQVMQQNGRLLLRLEAVEKELRIDPNAAPVPGLPMGDPAPDFEVLLPGGGSTSLNSLERGSKALMLLFSEPGCRPCEKLSPDVQEWEHDFADRFAIVRVSSHPTEHDSNDGPLRKNLEIGKAYRVEQTPSAVMIQNGRIASQLAVGPDQVRLLVAKASLAKPVKKGDDAPWLKLADLSGEKVNLADIRNRRTLLLFWSPTCGFCKRILADVQKWHSFKGAPELLVISSGTVEANRAQAIAARVLLDQYGSCDATFGVQGTPSAVLLNEEGRIVSEIAVGASAVFRLAGIERPAGAST